MEDKYEIIDIAMRNSYDTIVNGRDSEEIIETEKINCFIHNPNLPLKLKEIETMLEYFESTEEYEKCIQIKKIISWM